MPIYSKKFEVHDYGVKDYLNRTFEITEKNYKGYLELYLIRCFMKHSMHNKEIKTLIKLLALDVLVLTILTFILPTTSVWHYISGIIAASFAIGTFFAVPKIVQKSELKQLEKDYPYVCTDIDHEVLTKALEKVEIIKYVNNKKNIDKNGYHKYKQNQIIKNDYINKCENIKNEVTRDYKINSDISISEEQLEKVKVLVKK